MPVKEDQRAGSQCMTQKGSKELNEATAANHFPAVKLGWIDMSGRHHKFPRHSIHQEYVHFCS
jgi:hypothetical protein